MDDRRFDSLARALAGPSRRGLIGGLLAAALAPFAASGQRRGPAAEGPCGGGVVDKCAKDADCCNRHCNREVGRCRCGRSGEPCTQHRNCCDRSPTGPLTCQGAPGAKTCKPKPCSGERPPCHRCRRGVWVPDPGAAGDPCGAAESCKDGTATAAQVCDDQGRCPDGAKTECAPYRCAGDVCGSTCGDDEDCAGDAYCTDAEQCAEDRADGADCGRDEQCASGHCAQGVCCATACGGECEACDLAGSKGTCTGNRGKPCGEATCADGTFTPRGACDAAGACQAAAPVSCAPYAGCAGDACAETCGGDNDCTDDAYCDPNGNCVGDRADGQSCGRGEQCGSGFCADGVCCDKACGGACEACDLAGREGTCVADPTKAGRPCADGVCTAAGACAPCSEANPCPACQACDADTGRCAPDRALRHACDGPCPDGEWCDNGACAGIQATVTIPDCGSRCEFEGSVTTATLCGVEVTCPKCDKCAAQTGCASINTLPEGPAGAGWYCSEASHVECSSNGDCASKYPSFPYCTDPSFFRCTRICPY